MSNVRVYCIMLLLLAGSFAFAKVTPETSCVETSNDKITLLKDTLVVRERYSPAGKDDFIKKIMSHSVFCGEMYTKFQFNADGSFECSYYNFHTGETFNTQGTWDIKNGYFVFTFTGKQKYWSGKYKIQFYVLMHSKKLEYSYTFLIGTEDKTPWSDQGFSFVFK